MLLPRSNLLASFFAFAALHSACRCAFTVFRSATSPSATGAETTTFPSDVHIPRAATRDGGNSTPPAIPFGFTAFGLAAVATVFGRRSRRPSVSARLAIDAATAAAAEAAAKTAAVTVGDPIPNVGLDKGFPPEKLMLGDFCKGKKVILIGLPGAFTPT